MTDTEYNRRYYLEHGAKQTLRARLAQAESERDALHAELVAEHELNHQAVAEVERLKALAKPEQPVEQQPLPLCDSCGTAVVSRAAVRASSGLKGMPEASLAWLMTTYGAVPTVLCAACFIPALTGANHALAAVNQ